MKRILFLWLAMFLGQLATDVYLANASDGYTMTTINGKVIDFRALKGTPMVISVGSHW